MSDFPKPSSSAPYLLELISKKQLDPRRLTPHQRRICVRYLLQDYKHTQCEIATIFGVVESVISKDKKKIQEQNGWMIDEIDERKIAIGIVQSAEVATARLFRKGKEKEAFEVQRMTVDTLQSLGYLKRTPVEFKGALTLQEILKLAIDKG